MLSREVRIVGDVGVRSKENKGTENVKDEMVVEGYALRFDKDSDLLPHFDFENGFIEVIETISPNALKETDMSDVRFLFNHEPNQILGRSTNETLELKVDEEGLFYRAKLPNTTVARDVYENIKVGNINQCSFAMNISLDDYEVKRDGSGAYRAKVNKINRLLDVSAVTYPAYRETDVGAVLRGIGNVEDEKEAKEREAILHKIENLELRAKLEDLK